jgi:hypothetical protein
MTDAERAMELAEWYDQWACNPLLNPKGYRDTARLLREYAGQAEHIVKLEEALRPFAFVDVARLEEWDSESFIDVRWPLRRSCRPVSTIQLSDVFNARAALAPQPGAAEGEWSQ